MISAFLVVDKPAGITSHDVVAMVRAVTGVKKVGHTGTLDPFATGVLALALGAATRLISFVEEDLKVYDATISLGSATDTGDPTGQVIRTLPVPDLSADDIDAALKSFLGVVMQAPPRYSAVKVRGRPLYSYAREGKDVTAAPRPTRIDKVELLDRGPDWLRVFIECGKGTYARVLADEIASALGTAGHLAALRRSRSGPFLEADAMPLSALSQLAGGSDDWNAVLRPSRGPERVRWASRETVLAGLAPWMKSPMQVLSHMPVAFIGPADRTRVRGGGTPPAPPSAVQVGQQYLAVDGDEIVGIAVREPTGPRLVRLID